MPEVAVPPSETLALAKRIEVEGVDLATFHVGAARALGWEMELRPIETGMFVYESRHFWRRGDMSWTASGDVPPRYLEDLGAAWAECERRGWLPSVRPHGLQTPRRYEGCCWSPAEKGRAYAGRADTPAAALIAALLRAMAGSPL
jgi:hypothetical protein